MTKIESLTKLLEPQAPVIREAKTRYQAGLKAIDVVGPCFTVLEHCHAHGCDASFPPDYTDAAFIITERQEVKL